MAHGKPLHFVVLGGGISGLTAAHTILRNSPRANITLLESSKSCGGWLQSTQFDDGVVFEHGPRGIRPFGAGGAAVLNLVSDVGLENMVLPSLQSSKAGQQRFIYRNSKLVTMPTKVLSMMASKGPLSHRLYRLAMKDLTARKKIGEEDESVYSFFNRRFGFEAAEYLSDPFCRGVFAGDCRQLSVNACFPILVQMEKKYRSVIAGMLLSKDDTDIKSQSSLARKALDEKWRTWTLKNGLHEFGSAFEKKLSKEGVHIQLETPCLKLEEAGKQIRCVTANNEILADHVVSSIPAYSLNNILKSDTNKIEDLHLFLNGVPYVSCGVVNLQYDGKVLAKDGFGFLVPSSEDLDVLGVIFDTCTFPQLGKRNKDDTTMLTVMMGGAWYQNQFGSPYTTDNSQLEDTALKAIHKTLGIKQDPEKCVANTMKNCIPQYLLGHKERLDKARKGIEENGMPLTLTGATYDGVGIPDIVYKTQENVKKMLKTYY